MDAGLRNLDAQSLEIRESGQGKLHEHRQNQEGGIVFTNLNVYGFTMSTDYQKTFSNYPVAILRQTIDLLFQRQRKLRKTILQGVSGVVQNGEMLIVLGRPGSGCTTLLKTLAGDTYGVHVDGSSSLSYRGR